MSGAEKQTGKERRLDRAAERFSANLKIGRPGFGEGYSSKSGAKIDVQKSLKTGRDRIELSGILWLDPAQLQENPYNDYPPLSGEELQELARDIAEKGILVPLIVRLSEDVLICGHNRRRASIEAKETQVPVQRVLRLLTEEEERDIMRSENDRRRGGNWTREKKEAFIQEHFGEVIHEERRGAHKKEKSKRFTEPLADPTLNLAKEIEKKSRGQITEGTAKRIVSDMRRGRPSGPATAENKPGSLSETDRRRGEKLALHLKTLRQTREKLEEKLQNVKKEERRVLGDLKTIGQPARFGVE